MHDLTFYTAFLGTERMFRGPITKIILPIKQKVSPDDLHKLLIFSDINGQTLDLDLHGHPLEVEERARILTNSGWSTRGRGRPKLGVKGREISLLPRHWDWLETQPGGASATLRKLVEAASKSESDTVRQARERTYEFLRVIAGDMAGYEEAMRALFKGDTDGFTACMTDWPKDVRAHALTLLEA